MDEFLPSEVHQNKEGRDATVELSSHHKCSTRFLRWDDDVQQTQLLFFSDSSLEFVRYFGGWAALI